MIRLSRLTSALLLAALFFCAPSLARAQAEGPEPGDEIKIVLKDGNAVQGMLLGTTDLGYRITFAGTEVVVHYTSVASIEVVTPEVLLEEMRPGGARPTEPAPPPASPPSPEPEPEATAPEPVSPPPATEPASPPLDPVAPPVADEPPPSELRQEDSERPMTSAPPKPPSRGGGLMTTGFILIGFGTGMAVSTAVVDSGLTFSDSPDLLPALTVAGGVMAATGFGLAITGTIMKIVSGSRRRRWERTYGGLELQPLLAPGAGGLVVRGRF